MRSTRSALSASLLLLLLAAGCGVVADKRGDARSRQARDAYPPVGSFTEIDGRRVHYLQKGRGPDLVLIHGASGNVRDFTSSIVDTLADRYRVTVFDRPGLGYTDQNPAYAGRFDSRAESPREQAQFLGRAATRLDIENPIVMGHSYGGAVAMAWALENDPAALVIVSGATQPWPGGLGIIYEFTGTSLGGAFVVPLISAFAPQSLIERAIETVFAPQEPPAGYARDVGAALSLRPSAFRTNAQQVKTLRPHVVEMSRHYPALTLPVEIVHGTADEIVPPDVHSEPLARQLTNGTLTRLKGIGHMPHHVAPEAVVAAIDRAAHRAGLR